MVWKDIDRKIGFELQQEAAGAPGNVAPPPLAALDGAPRRSRPGQPGRGGNRGGQTQAPASVVPDGHGDRVRVEADGQIKLEASGNANLGTTYGTLTELNNMINSGNAALLANKDNEANISSIQIQLQRLQKILGIIEQNIAGKLQFGFGLIKMYDQVFQRPQLQG